MTHKEKFHSAIVQMNPSLPAIKKRAKMDKWIAVAIYTLVIFLAATPFLFSPLVISREAFGLVVLIIVDLCLPKGGLIKRLTNMPPAMWKIGSRDIVPWCTELFVQLDTTGYEYFHLATGRIFSSSLKELSEIVYQVMTSLGHSIGEDEAKAEKDRSPAAKAELYTNANIKCARLDECRDVFRGLGLSPDPAGCYILRGIRLVRATLAGK